MNTRVVLEGKSSWQEVLVAPVFILIFLPLVLSLIHIPTPCGFHLHFFQIAILLGAYLFGPVGGGIAGAAGSFAATLMMANPYIVVGNVILGAATGLFARQGIRPLFAIWLAFLMQTPWLILSDFWFMGLSLQFIQGLMISLFLSNTLWGIITPLTLDLFADKDD
jgi:uncharacterized membrane protein